MVDYEKVKKGGKKKGSKGVTEEGGPSGTCETTMDADNNDLNAGDAMAEDGEGANSQSLQVPSRSNATEANHSSPNTPGAPKVATVRKCRKCKNPGHTKNRCPQNIVDSVNHNHNLVDDTTQDSNNLFNSQGGGDDDSMANQPTWF